MHAYYKTATKLVLCRGAEMKEFTIICLLIMVLGVYLEKISIPLMLLAIVIAIVIFEIGEEE